jgi:hypothetical protein
LLLSPVKRGGRVSSGLVPYVGHCRMTMGVRQMGGSNRRALKTENRARYMC